MISIPSIGTIASAVKSALTTDYYLSGCVLNWSFESIVFGSVIDPINSINGLINGPTQNSWHKGIGMLFSGSGTNLISSSNPTKLNLSEISISFWIKTTTTLTSVVIEKNTTTGFSVLTSDISNTGVPTGRIIFATGGSGVLGYSSIAINDGKAHHIVCCKGSSGFKIYIDNIDRTLGGVSGSPYYGVSDFYVGSRNGNFRFRGYLDSIQIYNRFLTPADVNLLYLNT